MVGQTLLYVCVPFKGEIKVCWTTGATFSQNVCPGSRVFGEPGDTSCVYEETVTNSMMYAYTPDMSCLNFILTNGLVCHNYEDRYNGEIRNERFTNFGSCPHLGQLCGVRIILFYRLPLVIVGQYYVTVKWSSPTGFTDHAESIPISLNKMNHIWKWCVVRTPERFPCTLGNAYPRLKTPGVTDDEGRG